ncbi:hypothetical protein [Gordonia sp. NPDC003376]
MNGYIAIGSVRDRADDGRGVWASDYHDDIDQARKMLRQWHNEGRDIYRSIYRRIEPSHVEAGNCLPSNQIAFEVDAVADRDAARKVLRRVDPTLVASGSDEHVHVYLTITDATLDHDELKVLARGLYDAMGVTEGGKYGGGFLRVPGSLNHKFDPPRPVKVFHEGQGCSLAMLKATVRAHTTPRQVGRPGDLHPQPYGRLSGQIRHLLRENNAGGARRHRLTFKLVRLCQESGLSQGQTLAVLMDHPASAEKFDDLEREVISCWKPNTLASAG